MYLFFQKVLLRANTVLNNKNIYNSEKQEMVPELRKLNLFWKKDIIHINCTHHYEQTTVWYCKCYKKCGETDCCERVEKGKLS